MLSRFSRLPQDTKTLWYVRGVSLLIAIWFAFTLVAIGADIVGGTAPGAIIDVFFAAIALCAGAAVLGAFLPMIGGGLLIIGGSLIPIGTWALGVGPLVASPLAIVAVGVGAGLIIFAQRARRHPAMT